MQDTLNAPVARQRRWRRTHGFVAAAVFLVVAASVVAWVTGRAGTETAASTTGQVRTSEAANVTIEFTWSGPQAGLSFMVKMDTHSVDLDQFNLAELSVLKSDAGVEVLANSWDAAKGGHHREGVLTFPAEVDGQPLIGDGVRRITLIVRSVGVPERSVEWTW